MLRGHIDLIKVIQLKVDVVCGDVLTRRGVVLKFDVDYIIKP